MAAVFLPTSPACINLMQLHLLFLFCTHGIWSTTGLGKSHYCGGRAWAITNYISMEPCVNKLQHIQRQHLQLGGRSGVDVTNMATKPVDLFFGGGGGRVDTPNVWIKCRNVDDKCAYLSEIMFVWCRGLSYVGLVGVHAYLRKVLINFVLPFSVCVRPSVRMYQLYSHEKDFREIWY
jgi:hypothetical protein